MKESMSLEELDEYLESRSNFDRFISRVRFQVGEILDISWHLKRVKFFIQRGRRGYSDCDTWNLYSYLLDILPPALEDLKRIKHGVPTDCGEPYEVAEKEWDRQLQVMIDGFKAGRDMSELGLETTIEAYDLKYNELNEKFNKGMEMFSKRFFHLWD